jgi:pimeloyl-ACP methyl ester carboxylesterase
MRTRRDRVILAGAAGFIAVAAAGSAERRHMRRIAADPEYAVLRRPAIGRSVRVESSDGTALHAEVFGSGEAATIVLVHGWTEMLSYWTYVTGQLSEKGFRVVAYDLRGHGASARAPGGDYSLTRFGEDLEAVLAACVPTGERAVVAGHSLGAMSIASWAEHHEVQRRVSAAALINTGVGDLITQQLVMPAPRIAGALHRIVAVHGFLGARTSLPRFSTPLSHAAIRYVAFGPAASPAQVAFYERMLVSCPPDVRADSGIAMSEMELYHALPQLTVPTAVLAGALDRLTPPSHAERIAEMLPHLERLIVLPETGHMGPLERSTEVTRMLAELAVNATAGTSTVAA